MNYKEIKKYRGLLILMILLFSFVLFGFLLNIFNFSTDVYYYTYKSEIAICVVTLSVLAMSYVITSDYYSEMIKNENSDIIAKILMAVVLILISCLDMALDQNGTIYIFATSAVAIMFACFIGGTRMGLVVAAGTILMTLMAVSFSLDFILYSAVILFYAIVGGIICKSGYDKRNCVLTCVIFLIVRYIVLLVAFIKDRMVIEAMFAGLITNTIMLMLTTFMYIRSENLRVSKIGYQKNKNDLALASKIQMSAVPHDFPSSKTMESFGMMEPAMDVGGDFYDYFSIKQNLVAIVIADVSDKGLPAALFMMKAKGIIRSIAMVEHEPNNIMVLANRELCRDNVVDQFMTVWIGILDTDTGILRYSNAGHTPPYIRRNGGGFERMDVPKGLMMGVNDFYRYKVEETELMDGDVLFIYTDGVNEAFNSRSEEYGHKRLVAALNKFGDQSPQDMLCSVRSDIRSFTGNYPMSDDITMFCIRVYRSSYRKVTVKAENSNLDEITGFLEETLLDSECPQKATMKMEIVAEEIFVNICTHGYKGTEPGNVTMLCRYSDGEVKMVFYNEGVKFDPVGRDEIVIDEDVNNWTIGGFGIHMIKNLVDHANYKYLGGRNILTVWKKVE